MKLARASFADAHPKSGFAQRQRLAVVALEDFPLARWQAGHRGAHTHSEILRLVALRELVLLRSAVKPALDELIERDGPVVGARLPLRRGRALSATVPPPPPARPQKIRSGPRPSSCNGARTVRARHLLVNPRSGLFPIPTRQPAIPALGEHAGEPP